MKCWVFCAEQETSRERDEMKRLFWALTDVVQGMSGVREVLLFTYCAGACVVSSVLGLSPVDGGSCNQLLPYHAVIRITFCSCLAVCACCGCCGHPQPPHRGGHPCTLDVPPGPMGVP